MTDGPAPAAPTAPTAWQSFHLFLHAAPEDTDGLLTDGLAPLLDRLVADRAAASWFFIRYREGGPHLRIRVRGLAPEAAAGLPAALARLAGSRPAVPGPWPSRHGEVRPVPYRPETERYGGPLGLPIAEEVFAASSRTAVEALRRVRLGTDRLTLATDLAHATAHALGQGRLAAAQWLRRHAAGWRWVTEAGLLPGAVVHTQANTVYALQRETLVRRAAALRAGLDQQTRPQAAPARADQETRDGPAWEGPAWEGPPLPEAEPGWEVPWLAAWARQVSAADRRLREAHGAPGAGDPEVPDLAFPSVWAAQLHMLFNRLGVIPDQERAVCRLAARTLLDAGEPPAFFPSGHRAPDHQYLERSKFQIGRPQDTALRPLGQALAQPTARGGGADAGFPGGPQTPLPETPLPAAPLPDTPLRSVLSSRTSARGPLSGPLTAADLGTLLWSAHADSHDSERRLADGSVRTLTHRPYPSAGALHTARLRLLVLSVAGVPSGTYEAVPERRTLRPIGQAPTVDEIKALSSYLSRPSDDPHWIGVDDAPVVLGLYLELGLLRQRYGLRALRLGLLESGHLAQTLLLAATALGLSATPLGGFHDDLAQEVFGLDDLEQPLQYLLPLGRLAAQ